MGDKIVRVFTEEELMRLLDEGEAPDWYTALEGQATPASPSRRGSHNDPIDLDYLTREYVVREIFSAFEGRRVPKRLQADVTYAILEFAQVLGLVVERDALPEMRSFVSTDRLLRYWPKFFGGENPPSTPRMDLQ